MKFYCVLAIKVSYFNFPGKTHYLGLERSKSKAACTPNYFPGFWAKLILKIVHPVNHSYHRDIYLYLNVLIYLPAFKVP